MAAAGRYILGQLARIIRSFLKKKMALPGGKPTGDVGLPVELFSYLG